MSRGEVYSGRGGSVRVTRLTKSKRRPAPASESALVWAGAGCVPVGAGLSEWQGVCVIDNSGRLGASPIQKDPPLRACRDRGGSLYWLMEAPTWRRPAPTLPAHAGGWGWPGLFTQAPGLHSLSRISTLHLPCSPVSSRRGGNRQTGCAAPVDPAALAGWRA